MKKVAMIGVGKLGQDCAEVMANHYDVIGYDVSPRTPENFNMASSIEEAVRDRDLIFIAAPTPHDPIYGGETPTSHLPNKDFDYTIVKDILEEVNKFVNSSQLVVLISTVLPGTVRNILRPLITNARFIYNPYLIAMGTVKWDMVNPEMVIIGTDDGSLTGDAQELIEFYKLFMENNPRYEVGTWDEAESIKIFYNTFISAKVALVNMIQDVAEVNGNINVDVVTNALSKSTHRIMGPAYMTAGMGDGGACHPRDNIALRYLADRLDLGYDLFDAIMTAREKQAERMALKCLANGKRILIYGKAYKPNVPYLNGSSSMLVGHYIEKYGGELRYHDYNTEDIFNDYYWPDVILIGYWDDKTADYIQGFTNAPTGSILIIDPWRKIETTEGFNIRHFSILPYGNTRLTYDYYNNEIVSTKFGYEFPNTHVLDELLTEKYLMIHAEPNQDIGIVNFPMDYLINTLMEFYNKGYRKFIFWSGSEEFRIEINSKLTKLCELLTDHPYIKPKDIYYGTGGYGDLKLAYEAIFNKPIPFNVLHFSSCQLDYSKEEIVKEVPNVKSRSKKFLNFNRMPRVHRMQILEYLLANNLIDDGYVSFLYDYESIVEIHNDQMTLYPNIVNNSSKFPLILNIKDKEINPNKPYYGDVELHNDSYFSIVNETMFNTLFKFDNRDIIRIDKFFTEKTWKAMYHYHPFIMVNRAGSLKALREMGYKTFSPWIDESYDDIIDDDIRMDAICKEISRLVSLSTEEWDNIIDNIKDILLHNFIMVTDRNTIFKLCRDSSDG